MELGKLWIDDDGIEGQTAFRRADRKTKARLKEFHDKGYVILEGAVDSETVDTILEDVNRIYQEPDEFILKKLGNYVDPRELTKLDRADRLIDIYAISEAAREAIMAPDLIQFLTLIFQEDPIAMQSIYFEYGSQQAMHQDTAYVISGKPLSLAAAWIALEDIQEGSGELIYYPGCHRFDHYLFSGEHKNWVPKRDGQDQHQEFLQGLHDQAAARGIKKESFLARKGDILIWHADLAHGGSPITSDATRRSLVGHYCPVSVKPTYRSHIPDTYHELTHYSGGFLTSRHYDIAPLEDGRDARLIYDGGITKRRNAA